MKGKKKNSFWKIFFIALDLLLAGAIFLCKALIVIIAIAGLILNYGFIVGSIIILFILGVIWFIAVVRNFI